MRKLILFELNEVPYAVIDYFCQKYPESHLANTLPSCVQYVTHTEDLGEELHPWSTWPTLHRGVSNQQHHVKDLGEDLEVIDKEYPPIWKILQAHDVSTGVFASLHSYPMPKNYERYAFYVPDPFAADGNAHPYYLRPFQEFNLSMSRRSSRNVDSGIDCKAALKTLVHLPSIGITMKTLGKVAGQLVEELRRPHVKTRRRTYQSVLAFDIYTKLLRTGTPRFSTYFSNHVASAMHRYWAATFPNDYAVNNLPTQWIQDFGGEIDFAMEKFDDFFQELTRFADANPEYKVIVASSMGQKATIAELVNTRMSLNNMPKFLGRLGLHENDWDARPAMHPQYNILVHEPKVQKFTHTLDKLEVGGRRLTYRVKRGGFFSLDFGHANLEVGYALLNGERISFEDLGLCNEVIEDESAGTAYHDPEGSLFIYDPLERTTRQGRNHISTLAIAPSILENFGVAVPAYMSEGRIPNMSK